MIDDMIMDALRTMLLVTLPLSMIAALAWAWLGRGDD